MVNQGKVTFFFFFAVESWDLHTNTNWFKDKNQINWTYIKPWDDYQTPWLRMVLYALNSSVNVNVRHLYARKRFASSGPSVPWRENKYLDSSSFALPQVILHLLIYYNNLSIHTKKGAAINPFMSMSGPVGLVVWFSLRVREVPGSTPGQALFDKHVKWKTKLISYFNRP